MSEQRNKEFLTKLKDLLEEYKAEIHFDCSGDTSGIHHECLIIDVDGKQIHKNWGYWLEDINK